jgi:5-formyltetrahydrofolate cyclo-ligase
LQGDVFSVAFIFPALTMTDNSREFRQRLRAVRCALSAAEREQAASAVARQIIHWPVFTAARRIAGYWPCNGELDPMPLLERALAAHQQVYLPVLTDNPPQSLRFAAYRPDAPLRRNRFNIPEPDTAPSEWLEPSALDLVLTPLVAFDLSGNRLGMGGGFYDRSFALRRDCSFNQQQPYLLGLAYQFQQVPVLQPQPWDVPLDAVVTEAALWVFSEINPVGKR